MQKVRIKNLLFVDELFLRVRENIDKVPSKSSTGEGFKYALNQEKYLRIFLTDLIIPMDNNAAERAIRPFCILEEVPNYVDDSKHKIPSKLLLWSKEVTTELRSPSH